MAGISVGTAMAIARDLAAIAGAPGGPGGDPSRGITEQQATKLARAAVYFVAQHQQRLNVPAPAERRNGRVRYTGASAPGEYPRKRTGFLQANVAFNPTTIREIAEQGMVRVGLNQNAFYGAVLEVKYRRKGLKDTLADLVPQLQALAGMNLRYEVVSRFVNQ